MFGREKRERVAVLEVVERELVKTSVQSDMDAEYLELATQVGLAESAAVLNAKLLEVMHNENIQVYDLDVVEEYLDKKFRNKRWAWMPLRNCDADTSSSFDQGQTTRFDKLPISKDQHLSNSNHPWIRCGGLGNDVYSKPIPKPVLLTVKKIVDRFPLVHFFVSDESPRVYEDPFLAVVARGINNPFHVIERWDEPSFRG